MLHLQNDRVRPARGTEIDFFIPTSPKNRNTLDLSVVELKSHTERVCVIHLAMANRIQAKRYTKKTAVGTPIFLKSR